MMSSTISKTWKIVKPHVPLIHFKKGGRHMQNDSIPALNIAKKIVSTGATFSSSKMPRKYSRKQIGLTEMEAIERGGVQEL